MADLGTIKWFSNTKGFGFIEMPNVSEAQGAIKNLNYKTVGRNKIRVKHR